MRSRQGQNRAVAPRLENTRLGCALLSPIPGATEGNSLIFYAYEAMTALNGQDTVSMTQKTISINGAPVLTLWAAVVAQRLGFDEDEALTLGKAVAGLNAQTKGQRLGFFNPQEEKTKKAREKERGEEFWIEICGRPVPAKNTEDGIRAVIRAKEIEPDGVRRYLDGKFGEDLGAVKSAMKKLAMSYPPKELAEAAFGLYGHFRPSIPEGVKGWGAKGDLDLGVIEGLAKTKGSGS